MSDPNIAPQQNSNLYGQPAAQTPLEQQNQSTASGERGGTPYDQSYVPPQQTYAQYQPSYGQQPQPGQQPQGGYAQNPYMQYPPQQGYYMQPAPNNRWNVMCIVGFVLAFVLPPVGLVLSIIALVQINKTGEQSKGLAIAGIVLNAVFTVIIVAAIAFAIWIIGIAVDHADEYADSSYSYSGDYPAWCEYGLDNGFECEGYTGSGSSGSDFDALLR